VFLGKDQKKGPAGNAPTTHFENFIAAVRSRKTADQNGPVETAHYSSALAHVANIALRRGAILDFDPDNERFVNDEKANAMIADPYRKGFAVPTPDRV